MRYIAIPLTLLALSICIYYMGKRTKKLPWLRKIEEHEKLYWLLFTMLILAIYMTHTFLLGIIIYVFLFYVLGDLFVWLLDRLGKQRFQWWRSNFLNKGIPIFLAIIVSIYGYYNAKHMVFTDYQVTFAKDSIKKQGLRIVMLSDLHLGTAVEKKNVKQIVTMVNESKPDLICLVGDIFDERTDVFTMNEMFQALGKMKSTYGTFYVFGNHENYSKQVQVYREGLSAVGVTVLEDQAMCIDGQFYVVGRNDEQIAEEEGAPRKTIKQLVKNLDHSKPLILLDHKPKDMKEAKENGIDLQLSGHTHSGQIFPGNLIVGLANEEVYGIHEEESYHMIVSSGLGTWGFAMRVGSPSEIVRITLKKK